ncbi:MAG: hypothetical protein HWE18_12695 [Gammaproteobacteria bacterium]|nr:hypothetical protein [Gammaproteobacteria bacterium]
MKKVFLLLLLLPSIVVSETNSILGYFKDRSYWLNMPQGFYQDGKTAQKIGAIFLLIPQGYDFNSAPAVIYSAVFSDKNVEEVIKSDEKKFIIQSPSLAVNDTKLVKSHDGKTIMIKEFINPASRQQPYESVAYIQEGSSVVTVVVSAFVKANYEYILPEFIAMVSSYESADVKVKHSKSSRKATVNGASF